MTVFSLFSLIAANWQKFTIGLIAIFICVTALRTLLRIQNIRTRVETPLNILTLGFSGAGKTVLLTTLYGKLRLTGREGFSLAIRDKAESKYVDELYERLENGQMPPQTLVPDAKTWSFVCQVKGRKETYDVASFNYQDFPGEWVERIREPEPTSDEIDFLRSIDEADVLLGMLDGQAVVNFIKRDSSAKVNEQQTPRKALRSRSDSWKLSAKIHRIFGKQNSKQSKKIELPESEISDERFRRELYILLEALDGKKFKPFYFVLSKWDYVKQQGYNLDEVIAYLKEIPRFRTFLQGQTRLANIVRIIPVSSVGLNFFKYENGKRTTRGMLDPFQVEIILAYILLDFFTVQINKLRIDQKKWYRILANLHGKRWFLLRFLLMLLSYVTWTFQIGMLGLSLSFVTNKEFEKDPKKEEKDINNKKEAFEYIYKNFRRLTDDFEKEFPDSRIRHA